MDRKDAVDMHPSIPAHGEVVSIVSVVSMQPTSHVPRMDAHLCLSVPDSPLTIQYSMKYRQRNATVQHYTYP
jgi:hypothetical protein